MLLSFTADLPEKPPLFTLVNMYYLCTIMPPLCTIAREAVAARPQVGYIVVHFIFTFLKNGRL